METVPHNSAVTSGGDDDDDEDEDYNMFVVKRRSKRRAIIDEDDDDEKENKVMDNNDAFEKTVGAVENVPAYIVTENSADNKQAGLDKMTELTGRLFDSDNDNSVSIPDDGSSGSTSDDDSESPSRVHGAAKAIKSRPEKHHFGAEISDEDCPAGSSNESASQGNSRYDGASNDELDESEVDAELLAKLKTMKGASRSKHKANKSKAIGESRIEAHSQSQNMLGALDDDELDESEVDPELLAKLNKMKGASRSGRKERKSKTIAEDRMETYSQSQKMLRDSRVNLPYHEPEPKLLDDFLARATQKRLAYAGLTHAKDIQKAQIICDKLSSPSIVATSSRQRATYSNTNKGSVKRLSANLKQPQTDNLHAVASQVSSEQEAFLVQKCSVTDAVSSEDDELPDLQPLSSCALKHTSSITDAKCDNQSQEGHTMELDPEFNKEAETEVTTPSLQLNDKSYDSLDDKAEHTISLSHHEQNQTLEQVTVSPTEGVDDFSQSIDNVQNNPKDSLSTQSPKVTVTACPIASVYDGVEDSPKDNSLNSHSPLVTSVTCPTASVSEALVSRTSTSKLRDRLSDLHLPVLPSLRGPPDGMICLDEVEIVSAVRNTGLGKLMDRLVQHSNKNVSAATYGSPSVLNGDNLILSSDSVTEMAETDKGSGSKLDRLKQQLGVDMMKKRAEARSRRLQLFALENEEGFEKEGGEKSNFDDEEAEMTDGSDTDDDEEEEEDEEVDYKLKLNIDGSDDDNDYNPFVDNEASEDDDDENSNPDVHLHFDVSDEEGEKEEHFDERDEEKDADKSDRKCGKKGDNLFEDDNTEDETCMRRKQKKRICLESDEDDESIQEPEKDTAVTSSTVVMEDSGLTSNQSKWSNEMTSLSSHLQDTLHQQRQSKFRRENSQSPDLYSTGMIEDSASSHGRGIDHLSDSFYRSQSQKFDVDSILKLVQTQPRTRTPVLTLRDDENDRDFDSHLNMSAGKIFHDLASQPVNSESYLMDSQQDNMKQLLGLCSGTFGPITENNKDSQSSHGRSTQSFPVSQSYGDDDVHDPFNVLSEAEDDVTRQRKQIFFSDHEDGNSDDDDSPATDKEDDDPVTDKEEGMSATDDEEEPDYDKEDNTEKTLHSDKFTELKKKRKKYFKNEFLEEEAELSGSEYDSDENLDLAEEDDVLEDEEGDLDLLGVSEDKLRDQVGKLHMKQLQDDDDRRLMRFKEMYLQDGDLYSEGAGRMRNFRWKDMDHNSQPDLFAQNSDDEQPEEDEEVLWRRNRFEREKLVEEERLATEDRHSFYEEWMMKRSRHQDAKLQAEDSQVLRMGHFFVKKQESFLHANDQVSVTSTIKSAQTKSDQTKGHMKGSFLCRGKETLVRIAQMVSAKRIGNSGKNSKNFVFHTVGAHDTEEEKTETSEPEHVSKKRKAHTPASTPQTCKKPKLISTTATAPGDKRPRPQLKQQCSIFELIEQT